ncbi:hypothetical protein K501DRAFT_335324 [Backusella circina FSU 941]|nr:hypothetical protein K501DRAFT_335324 [Backusella circina FSU 941]
MSSSSPQETSPQQSRSSAFQWPIPPSSPNNSSTEISVKQILDKYSHDPEILKHALMAKSEEDKKQTAHDTLKTEQARIQLKYLDLELAKEQAKTARQQQPVGVPYYGLAPIQQQVLARIHGTDHPQTIYSPTNIPSEHHTAYPASPVVAYPHSAHPLCPPSDNRLNLPRQYLQPPTHAAQQPTTPISPGGPPPIAVENRKRTRASISYSTTAVSNNEDDKISHNKVMEALKAKIQRTSHSPLATTAPNSILRPTAADTKRQRTLPKPISQDTIKNDPPPIVTGIHHTPSTPSPRSAKPILPPIDTSMGRIHAKSMSNASPTAAVSRPFTTSSPSDHALNDSKQPSPPPAEAKNDKIPASTEA